MLNHLQKDIEDKKISELHNLINVKQKEINHVISDVTIDMLRLQDAFKISTPELQEKNLVSIMNDRIKNNPNINEFTITNQTGSEIINISKPTELTEVEVNDALSQYIQSHLTDIPYTKIFMDSNNNPVILAIAPLDTNNFSKFLVVEVNLKQIYAKLLDNTSIGKTGEILLGQKSDEIVVLISPLKHNINSDYNFNINEKSTLPIVRAVQGISDCGKAVDYRSEPVLACWQPLDVLDLGIVAKIDQKEVFESIDTTKIITIAVFGATIFVIIIVSFLVSRGIQKPVLELKNALEHINTSKLDTEIIIRGNDELTALSKSFVEFQTSFIENEDKKKLYQKELEKKLVENNNFKNALDESTNVSITDTEGNITYVNTKFMEISGYSESELIGQNHRILKSGHHPPEFYKNIWDTISRGNVWRGDIKNMAKNGNYFWTKTVIIPMFGKNKTILQYIAVRSDITKQKEDETRLRDALIKIERTAKLKSEFASMVTHELKTPLTPILGYCEMLKEKSIGELNDMQLECIAIVESNALSLERLIGDILDVQKLDMEQMVFNKTSIDVRNYFIGLMENSYPLMNQKQIQLIVPPIEKLVIFADKIRLDQIFSNLIRNAVDFVSDCGIIEIGVKSEKNRMIFFVKDNGIGIAKESQPSIFKRFYQVDTTHTRKHGGTGLGLSICKGVVEGLGGQIWFESQEGKGTTFFFSIPVTPDINLETNNV
ncbi:MAG: ATP-binding protein [Nitrosarchaeum sp.]